MFLFKKKGAPSAASPRLRTPGATGRQRRHPGASGLDFVEGPTHSGVKKVYSQRQKDSPQ